jgi:hypothetical protein
MAGKAKSRDQYGFALLRVVMFVGSFMKKKNCVIGERRKIVCGFLTWKISTQYWDADSGGALPVHASVAVCELPCNRLSTFINIHLSFIGHVVSMGETQNCNYPRCVWGKLS